MAGYANPYNLGTMEAYPETFNTSEQTFLFQPDSSTLYHQLTLELDLVEARAHSIFAVHQLKLENDRSINSNVYADNIFEIVKDIQEKVSPALSTLILQWKHQQQRLENGVSLRDPININSVEEYISRAFVLTVGLMDYLKSHFQGYQCHPCFLEANVTLHEMLNLSVVITSQPNAPNHVIREKTRFPRPVQVRFLIGKTGLDKRFFDIRNKTLTLMNELEARRLHSLETQRRVHAIDSFQITSEGNGTLDKFVDPEEDKETLPVSLRLNFKQIRIMKVKRIKEDDNGNPDAGLDGNGNTVMDEKLCLLFSFKVSVMGLDFTIWTTTFPFTVSLHKNQNALGAATVIWDDAVATVDRVPFKVDTQMLWTEFAKVLSGIFQKVNLLGLTEDHLTVLYSKLFPPKSENLSRESYEYVTWKMLHEKKFTPTVVGQGEAAKFSFWDWFYAALKCLDDENKNNKQLKKMWSQNLIKGFISRQDTEILLTGQKVGTFLLRFSDSSKGKLSISCVHTNHGIMHLNPYSLTEFKEQCLALQILNMKEVKFLYPELHNKSLVFNRYIEDVVTPMPFNPYTMRISAPFTADINGSERSQSPVQAQSPRPQNADSQQGTSNAYLQHSTEFVSGSNISAFPATVPQIQDPLPSFGYTFRTSYSVPEANNGQERMQFLQSDIRHQSNTQYPTNSSYTPRYIDDNMEEDNPFPDVFLRRF